MRRCEETLRNILTKEKKPPPAKKQSGILAWLTKPRVWVFQFLNIVSGPTVYLLQKEAGTSRGKGSLS